MMEFHPMLCQMPLPTYMPTKYLAWPRRLALGETRPMVFMKSESTPPFLAKRTLSMETITTVEMK